MNIEEIYKLIESLYRESEEDYIDDSLINRIFDNEKSNELKAVAHDISTNNLDGLDKLRLYLEYLESSAEINNMSFGLSSQSLLILDDLFEHETELFNYLSELQIKYIYDERDFLQLQKGFTAYPFEVNSLRRTIVNFFIENYERMPTETMYIECARILKKQNFFRYFIFIKDMEDYLETFSYFHMAATLVKCYLHVDGREYGTYSNLIIAYKLYGAFEEQYSRYSRNQLNSVVENAVRSNNPRTKGKSNQKNIIIPIARRIWMLDKESNVFMPKTVAKIISRRIKGKSIAPDTLVRWFKEEKIIPPEIIEKISENNFELGGSAAEKRKELERIIINDIFNDDYIYFDNLNE